MVKPQQADKAEGGNDGAAPLPAPEAPPGFDKSKLYSMNHGIPTEPRSPSEPVALSIPPVYRGEGGAAKNSVDTAALKHFAAAMRSLNKPVEEALRQLGRIDARAGAFPHADTLVSELGLGSADAKNANDLCGSYRRNVLDLQEGLRKLADGMDKTAARYESAEQTNSSAAADIMKVVNDAGAEMRAMPVRPVPQAQPGVVA